MTIMLPCYGTMSDRKMYCLLSLHVQDMFAASVKCKYCNVTKFSKKDALRTSSTFLFQHYKQEHLHVQHPVTSPQPSSFCNNIDTKIAHTHSSNVVNAMASIFKISSSCKPDQPESVALSSSTFNTHAIYHLYQQFNWKLTKSGVFFKYISSTTWLSMWHSMVRSHTHTVNFSYNLGTLEDAHFFFKNYKLKPIYSSKHHVNQMALLQMTINHSNVNNNILLQFSSHNQDNFTAKICTTEHVFFFFVCTPHAMGSKQCNKVKNFQTFFSGSSTGTPHICGFSDVVCLVTEHYF